MSKDPQFIRLQERYETLKRIRSSYEDMLNAAQQYVTPNRTAFDRMGTVEGTRQDDGSKRLFDHTAVWANQMFANGMASYLMPKSDRWAYLKPVDTPSAELKDDELIYLELLSNRIFHLFSIPQSQFYMSGHESFHSLGSFGNAVVYVDQSSKRIQYKSCPLADSFFDTGHDGSVDTVFYRKWLSTKALIQKFPDVVNIDGFDPEATSTTHELVYAVEPSVDIRAQRNGRVGNSRPYQAFYFLPRFERVVQSGGMHYFPFMVPRWMVVAGETLGRGPAFTCLSQIQVLNKMVKEVLKSAELANRPPLSAEEDSLLLPIAYGPGRILYRTPGTQAPEPLLSGSQPQITLEMIRDYREQITRAFFVDQIIRDQKKERQSVLEIQDERGQMLQQLGPLLARIETEYLSPSIEHAIRYLKETRDPLFDQVPQSLDGREMQIVYTSPAAHAQYASGLSNISGFIQDLAPLLQAKPEILDNIDEQEFLDTAARMRNITRKVLVDKKSVAKQREARAQQEEMQMAAANAPQMAGALKDVASARATDPQGIGQLM